MIEEKLKGHDITIPPPPRADRVVDIYAALKKSLETARPRQAIDKRNRRKANGD